MSVIDNTSKNRYELHEEGHTAFATYARQHKEVHILHVESPAALRGKGTAGRLMQGILNLANAAGDTLVPVCSYAVHWLNKHH